MAVMSIADALKSAIAESPEVWAAPLPLRRGWLTSSALM